ncbi:hypothetical protein, variant [Fonticula alba]|nr:hypothetical protein, variant [Fonticula alba]KCV72089.1 hypothetical protein, variant [Fonticula alba]|eukprot:XP_009493666.1 hypothetical protein, variant [Fonticula alba]
MQHTYLPVSCFAFGAGPATVGSSAAATAESAACASAPMSSETAATAPGQGWLPLSVFLATPAGMVYAVSPFVPRSCHMSLELLRALRASCRVSHASAEQAAWVDSLYLVEFNKFSLRSERLPSVQGPFLLSSPESTNFQPTLPTPSATSTVDAVLATPVTGDHALLTLFYGCGALHSALHLHGILPQWQTGAGEVSAHPLLAGSRADYAKLYPMRAFNFGQGAPATGQDHQFMATPLAGAEACLIFSPSSVYLLDFSPLCLGLRRFFSSLAGPVGVHATLPQALLAPENLLCRVSCLLRVFSTRQAISDCLLVRPDLGPLALRPGTDSGDCPALLVVSLHQSSGTFTTACLPFDLAKHAASGTAAPPGRVPVLVPGNEASVSDHVAYVRSLLDEIPISTRMIVDDHADEQKMQMLAETFAEAARARSLPILSYVSSMFMMIFNRIDQAKAGQTEEAELLDQAWQKLSGQNTQLQERIRQNTARAEALKSKLSALLILHLKSKSATISTAEQEHFNRLEDQSRHVEQLQLGLERLEERIGSLKGAAMAATAAQEGAGSSVPAELLAADPERAVALLFPPREGLLISEELLSLRTSIMSLKSSLSSAETRLSHLL